MPTYKKAAKKSAKAKRGGARRVKASVKVGKAASRSAGRASTAKNPRAKRKAEIRAKTRSQTASNLESTGKKQMATGKKTTKVKDQVVTPKSAHAEQKKKYGKSYGGMAKTWRKGLPKRKKR
jgi:hypothetical protein